MTGPVETTQRRGAYRLVYLGLAALAVAVISLAVVFLPEGEPVDLPGPIQAVSPAPGDTVLPQAVLEVKLDVGYRAEIIVDGFPVDPSFVEATGLYSWRPSPADPSVTAWSQGVNLVEVRWERVTGVPDVGEFSWSFTVR